jgi:hypothetical protein
MAFTARGELSDPHTWGRTSVRRWADEMRAHGPASAAAARPGYIFDQSGGASAALRGPMAELFPWARLLRPESRVALQSRA